MLKKPCHVRISTEPNLKTYKLLIDDRMYESQRLIDAHHFETVVYAVFIMSLDDKSILIKIGSTKI
jgi:hypothetical protein